MKLTIDGWNLKVEREPGDPRYTQGGYAGGAAAESRLLFHVKQKLQDLGLGVIKRRMSTDGAFCHLVDDRQQYIRSRTAKGDGPKFYIYNDAWAIYDAGEKLNENGVVWLAMGFDIFNHQTDEQAEKNQRQMLAAILSQQNNLEAWNE